MCEFCNIVNKNQSAYIVYESENTVAFLDMEPINEGHVLIVPKLHEASIHKMPIELLTEIMEVAQMMVVALEKVYGMKGYSIMQNGGEFCDFGHGHFHVFPRYRNDGFGWTASEEKFEYSQKVADKIAKVMEK